MFKKRKDEGEEEFFPLSPVNFFHLIVECPYYEGHCLPGLETKEGAPYLLPDTSSLCNEEPFAKVGMGWNEEGLLFRVEVEKPLDQVVYPEIEEGESVELFIDTRDVKTSGFNTRFCHHFFFLPEAVNGHHAGELTHFRTEDAHPLCDPKDLSIKIHRTSSSYRMDIRIPSHCLVGYDPGQFDRLGFNLRINRSGGDPQHFCALTKEYRIEEQPSLWSSVRLKQGVSS